MLRDQLKIPKKLKLVTLWVHPEGRVVGSLFLRPQSANRAGEEEPLEVLNTADPFLVLKRDQPDELRFYNKSSVVRVEYDDDPAPLPSVDPLALRAAPDGWLADHRDHPAGAPTGSVSPLRLSQSPRRALRQSPLRRRKHLHREQGVHCLRDPVAAAIPEGRRPTVNES